MSTDDVWPSHDLVPDREIKIAGDMYRQRRCQRCRRDFVMAPGSAEWVAVRVSVFDFTMLDGETNRRWLSEECPGPPHE